MTPMGIGWGTGDRKRSPRCLGDAAAILFSNGFITLDGLKAAAVDVLRLARGGDVPCGLAAPENACGVMASRLV